MKSLLRQDKGVSAMVGYVLMIAIAIGLSIGVFFYLKLYLPSEKPQCHDDVAISIDSVNCVMSGIDATVTVELTNRGHFTIDTAYIKIGEANRVFKTTLNDVEARLSSPCNGNEQSLEPGENYCDNFVYEKVPPGALELSVEPLLYIDNEPALCPKAIVTQTVQCQ